MKAAEIGQVTINDEAMIPLLQPGDIVTYLPIRPGPEVGFVHGTIVAIETYDGEKIVRKYCCDDEGSQWLQPFNPEYQGEDGSGMILGMVISPEFNIAENIIQVEQ